jgi:molybdopterin-containing oxidoreductase family membrane subunit
MAPLFVVSAIVSGTSLIAVISAALQKFTNFRVEPSTWQKLSGLMVISLAVDLFFLVCEYVTILWGAVPKEMIALKMLLPGGEFYFLSLIEWVGGGILPLILLVWPRTRRRVPTIVTSAGLILAGVYAFQIELTAVGMANPLIQLPPGMSLGTFTLGRPVFQLIGQYSPTWVEYAILLGLVAFATSVFVLGCRFAGIWRQNGDDTNDELGRGNPGLV